MSEKLARASGEIDHLKSAVEVGAENALREAKQALRRARYAAEDAREEMLHQMKRHPLESAGTAFGVGLLAGVALGFALFGRRRRTGGDAAAA
jgi:ElaB/YqjD/DUF883 family membrane-anchored ribosome-binding protein